MTIGILGAGQLGMMLAEAGKPLDLEFRFFDPSPEAPARSFGEFVCAPYEDEEALLAFAANTDIITYEFENIPVSSLEILARAGHQVLPSSEILRVAQDRLNEKTIFEQLAIPVPKFAAVDSLDDLQFALQDIGFPAVLKTRRMGYDGKGQAIIRSIDDVETAWKLLGEQTLILEEFIPFDRELSLIGVRSKAGEIRCYPLIENTHREGILRLSRAPISNSDELQISAEGYLTALLEHFSYVGVLTLELFQKGNQLIANEMAPRVHNSGHLTIEAAKTSQFENHLRAVCGLPLGPVEISNPAAMINLIGTVPDAAALQSIPGAHVHLYGKEPRPNRKLGHVTITGVEGKVLEESIAKVQALL